jgi:anti-sigma factor RsiW
MNQTSSHQEMELLPAAALEILEGEELGRVLAHTRECPECARLLEGYRAVAAALTLELPHQPLDPGRSARLRDRLLIRARNEPTPTDRNRSAARAGSRWGGADRWAGWAVAAGMVGVLLTHHGFHRPLAYGWIVAGLAVIALVGSGVYALVQRRRVSELENQLAQRERDAS